MALQNRGGRNTKRHRGRLRAGPLAVPLVHAARQHPRHLLRPVAPFPRMAGRILATAHPSGDPHQSRLERVAADPRQRGRRPPESPCPPLRAPPPRPLRTPSQVPRIPAEAHRRGLGATMQQPQCDHVWTDWQETRPFTSRRRCRACGLTNDRPRARRGPRQGRIRHEWTAWERVHIRLPNGRQQPAWERRCTRVHDTGGPRDTHQPCPAMQRRHPDETPPASQ